MHAASHPFMGTDSPAPGSNSPAPNRPASTSEPGLLFLVSRQALAALLTLLVVAPGVAAYRGWTGLATPAIAAVVCLAGAVAGMAAVAPFRGVLDPFQRMAVSMLVRMGVPLAFCLWAIQKKTTGPLAGDAFALFVVLFYLVTLAVEVWAATVGRTPRRADGP